MTKEIMIEIKLTPVTKKNSQQIYRNSKTGKTFIMPSAKYRQYIRDCRPDLIRVLEFLQEPINEPVNIQCIFYMPNRRRCDLTNLLEAVDDILVSYGILKDDCYAIVAGHDGSRVRYDKNFPRTEITITRMFEQNGESHENDKQGEHS